MKVNLKKSCFLLAASTLAAFSSLCAHSEITPVITDQAPVAIGPYSQAIKAGSYLFISGQIAIDPATGKLSGETIEEQTIQVLHNLEAILAAEGLTFKNVVKSEVYLQNLGDFQAMNAIYAQSFSYAVRPARATVEVSKLPLSAMVEISCIAYIPNSSEK